METKNKTYADILSTVKSIDTTASGGNGYPRRLSVAYTADTMGELRELYDAAIAEGHEVDVVTLHRRDGWALWERQNHGSVHDLDADRWMGTSDQDWTITIDKDSDTDALALDAICGDGYTVQDAVDLFTTADAVKALSAELPDPDELEEGEEVIAFCDANNGWTVDYTIKTGQNGYSYDTHQYCTGLIITEREEEEDEEEDED